jgi:hypothetical protein
MRDWRAAKKAQERVHDVAAQVATLRALSQGALMEQIDSRSGNSACSRTMEGGEQSEGRSVTAEQRALNFLSEAEALLISRAASTQPVEHNLQLGGVCLAKAQILVRAGDQTAALKMLGEARKAYVAAESGSDVAISDSLNGLVLLELASKGHPMLFAEAVSSFERAANFFERHQIGYQSAGGRTGNQLPAIRTFCTIYVELIRGVLEGSVDFAVVTAPGSPQSLDAIPLPSEDMLVALAPKSLKH